MRHAPRRLIAHYGRHKLARKKRAQLHVIVPRKELTYIFIRATLVEIMPKQSLNRVRYFARQATISNRTCNRLVETDCAADAEVVSILHAVAYFNLLAFDTDVGDPVLPAAVRTPSDMQLQVLLKTGQAFFKFFHQPARKRLGLSDGKLAEFRPAARHGAAPESRTLHWKARAGEFFREYVHVLAWNIDDQQVLHVGGTNFAAS